MAMKMRTFKDTKKQSSLTYVTMAMGFTIVRRFVHADMQAMFHRFFHRVLHRVLHEGLHRIFHRVLHTRPRLNTTAIVPLRLCVLFLLMGLPLMLPEGSGLQARQLLPDPAANETHTTDSGLDVYPMDVALERATAEGKKILMDVYAVWCPYCKQMHTQVYTDPQVQEAIEKYFYLVKVNVEGSDKVIFRGETFTETSFARALNVTSYPSTFFVDTGENILGMQPGVVPAETFAYLLSYVGSDEYKKRSFEEYLPEDVKKRMQSENQ